MQSEIKYLPFNLFPDSPVVDVKFLSTPDIDENRVRCITENDPLSRNGVLVMFCMREPDLSKTVQTFEIKFPITRDQLAAKFEAFALELREGE